MADDGIPWLTNPARLPGPSYDPDHPAPAQPERSYNRVLVALEAIAEDGGLSSETLGI
jgi:hypothetical protein